MRVFVITDNVIERVLEANDIASVATMFPNSEVIEADGSDAWASWRRVNGEWKPPGTVPSVPVAVTMRQARLALHAAGIYSLVDGAIASLEEPGRTTAQIEWEYATELRRDHQLIAMIGAGLGMTEEEIDSLFSSAASIV